LHRRTDEAFYVLEGELTFHLDHGPVEAGPGDFVLVSHGVVHTFENAAGSEARFLEVAVPGAFAGYFEELLAALPAGGGPPDPETIAALYEKYDIVPADAREDWEQTDRPREERWASGSSKRTWSGYFADQVRGRKLAEPTGRARLETLSQSSARHGIEGGAGGLTTLYSPECVEGLFSELRANALVMAGGASVPFMRETARALDEVLPDGRHRILEGQEHNVDPAVLAPVLREFFEA
jgi:hypothetical protein